MLHGLRDTAWSLLGVADQLHRAGHRVLLPELRGHGESARSEAYGMPNFLLDLDHVLALVEDDECALFGHSLGGHIVTRYAALFPERVRAVIAVEGLGPPARAHETTDEGHIAQYRTMLENRLGAPRVARPIASLAEVAARLRRNNPRLDPDEATRIAPHLVAGEPGAYEWAFDPRANSVFIGSGAEDRTLFWGGVRAPTLLVSGALSYEYWGREMANDGHFAEGEMETRIRAFAQAEHHWFEHSGHMVHYDEPDRLAKLCIEFLDNT